MSVEINLKAQQIVHGNPVPGHLVVNQELPTIPMEIFGKIFRNFDFKHGISAVSLVCREWNAIAAPYACELQLHKKTSLTKQEMDIYKTRIRATDWDGVFGQCKSLKALDFSQCSPEDFIGDDGLIDILKSAAKYCDIEILNFEQCANIYVGENVSMLSHEVMICLAENYKGVKDLNLNWCGINGVRDLMLRNLVILFEGCCGITSLDLGNNCVGFGMLKRILPKLKNVQKLNFFGNFGHPFTNAYIQLLGEHCPNLTHLALPISMITDEGLENLAELFPNLQYLYLPPGHYEQWVFVALQEQMPNLRIQTEEEPNFEWIEEEYPHLGDLQLNWEDDRLDWDAGEIGPVLHGPFFDDDEFRW